MGGSALADAVEANVASAMATPASLGIVGRPFRG